jgi:hypothetical protein
MSAPHGGLMPSDARTRELARGVPMRVPHAGRIDTGMGTTRPQVRGATLRKRIAGTCAALLLAITFGVMGTTGIALVGGDKSTETTTTTIPAETQTVPVRLAGGGIHRLHVRSSIQSASRRLPTAYG